MTRRGGFEIKAHKKRLKIGFFVSLKTLPRPGGPEGATEERVGGKVCLMGICGRRENNRSPNDN